jgi:predicted alpha/beta hydrolase family esterase
MSNDIFLILHGLGGNSPEHWQDHLYNRLIAEECRAYYPEMPNPFEPQLDAWLERLQAELDTIASDWDDEAQITVLAHSLGATAWMHFAAANVRAPLPIAERVLLIAPPHIDRAAPPSDVPASVVGFFPPPLDPAGIKAVASNTALIVGDNDDYVTVEQAGEYAANLGIPLYVLAGAGHISPYYGYGEWPWAMDWCLRLSDLPPQPR